MVAVVTALGISGAGLVADAAGRAVIIIDMHWVVLGIKVVPTQIIHKLADVIAKVAGLARVVVVVVIAAAAVVACWLAFDAVGRVFMVVVGNLRLFWLLDQACLAISYGCDVGLFLHLVAIRFSFGGFGDFGLQWRCGSD